MAKLAGVFYSKYLTYEFPDKNGVKRYYKAKWFGNPFAQRADEIAPILGAGYDAGGNKWPKAILWLTEKKWNELKADWGTWVGLTKIHAYDTTVNAGTCPAWAKTFDAYDGFTIHEYAPGKIVFIRNGKTVEQMYDEIYNFFVDAPAPPVDPVTPPVNPPVEQPDDDVIIVPSRKYRVTGKVWFMPVDLTIEAVDE